MLAVNASVRSKGTLVARQDSGYSLEVNSALAIHQTTPEQAAMRSIVKYR